MRRFMLTRLSVLFALCLLLTGLTGGALAAENDGPAVGELVIVEAQAPETSAPTVSLFSLDGNGNAALKDGNHVQWIDRLDLSDAAYASQFYNWLVENSDNDGTDDALIDVTEVGGSGDAYLHAAATVNYSVEYIYSEPPGPDYAGRDAVSNVWEEKAEEIYAHLLAAFYAFDRDHPEVFWLDGGALWGFSAEYGTNTYANGEGVMEYSVTVYLYLKDPNAEDGPYDIRAVGYQTPEAIRADIAVRDSTVNTVMAAATGTVQEKLDCFNDWLTQNNCYNSSADLNSIAATCRECIGALKGETGATGPVCEAYARAFKVLCDKAGIPCVLVDGIASGAHMWNNVRMDDEKWYAVDVTWNDPTVYGVTDAVSGYESDDYLLVGANTDIDGRIFSESHYVTNSPAYGGPNYTNGPELSDSRYVPPTTGGSCGTGVTWTLTRTGVLTVSGSGAMTDYEIWEDSRPWDLHNEVITQVVIGKDITHVGDYVFRNCPNLSKITVEAGNANYCSVDGVLFNKAKTQLIQYPVAKTGGIYRVPETVTSIKAYAFYRCEQLTDVVLPAGLTGIGEYGFCGCTGLTGIAIPAGVTTIANYAFEGCSGMIGVTVFGNVTGIGMNAFSSTLALEKIALPASLTWLLDSAFYNSGLTEIYFAGTPVQWNAVISSSSDQLPDGVTVYYNCSAGARVTTQPTDVSRFSGSAQFTVGASGSGLSYQWQYKTPVGTKWNNTTLSGWNTPTLTVPVNDSTDGRSYRCVVTDSNGLKAISAPALLTKSDTPEITLDTPVLTEAFNSATGVRVSWKAVDGAERYRLLRKNLTKGETEWSSVGETTECTLIDKTAKSASRYTFTVECIDADGYTLSERDETGRTCTYIAMANITGVTSVEDGLEIEWQKPAGAKNFRLMRKVDGGAWKVLTTGQITSYVDTDVEPGVKYWYTVRAVTLAGDMCINSYNSYGWSGRWIRIVTQPADQTAFGGYVYFTVEAEGASLTYQWQYKTASGTTWANTTLTGCNSDTLRVAASANNFGRSYRCIVTDTSGKSVTTEVAKLIKAAAPKITAQPEDQTAPSGYVYFTVSASGTGLKYQWQVSANGGKTWNNTTLTGWNTDELQVMASAANDGRQYRCIVTDAYGQSVTSAAAKLYKRTPLSIDAQPEDQTAPSGYVYFNVEAAGDGLTYQWQYSANKGATWANTTLTGWDTDELQVMASAANNGRQYRCIVTDKYGNEIITDAATLIRK